MVEKNIKEIRETIVGEDAIKAGSSEPEMDPALFPMGRKALPGTRGKVFVEPPLPQEESSKPLLKSNQSTPPKKKGLFNKLFRKKSEKES